MKRNKWISDKKYTCEKCNTLQPAYYTLSLLTKGLFIQCANCGIHTRPYVPDLDLPYKPSKHYLRNKGTESIEEDVKISSRNIIHENNTILHIPSRPIPIRHKKKRYWINIPECPIHKRKMRLVPAGISKRTGKPYDAFWSCFIKVSIKEYCPQTESTKNYPLIKR